jgi:hypothetical protein
MFVGAGPTEGDIAITISTLLISNPKVEVSLFFLLLCPPPLFSFRQLAALDALPPILPRGQDKVPHL